MTNKERNEMTNLRNRVLAQREEIKRLQAEVDRLRGVVYSPTIQRLLRQTRDVKEDKTE